MVSMINANYVTVITWDQPTTAMDVVIQHLLIHASQLQDRFHNIIIVILN